MRRPGTAVLRPEHAMQGFAEIGANILQLIAHYSERGAAAEVDDSRHLGSRPLGSGVAGQPARKLRLDRWWQLAEQGEMRGNAIALRRIVQLSQRLEPGEVVVAE